MAARGSCYDGYKLDQSESRARIGRKGYRNGRQEEIWSEGWVGRSSLGGGYGPGKEDIKMKRYSDTDGRRRRWGVPLSGKKARDVSHAVGRNDG